MNSSREILERPFPPELIRHRPGRNGEDVVYIDAASVTARLNLALAGEWSFTIEKHEILEDEVVVLGRLTAGAVSKSAFGSSAITRARSGGKAVSIGDDLKAAATDALKKGATLLGVGLTLHSSGVDAPQATAPAPASPPVSNGNGYLSSAQLRAIHAIRRKLGWTDAQLAEFGTRIAGCTDVEQMSKKLASTFIERLQAEAAPAGASR